MALTKFDIVEQVSQGLNFSMNKSRDLVESLIELIKSCLESGEDVLISRFGKFCVKDKKPRRGRNPSTGESIILPARRVVTFRCSGNLKTKLNGN